MDTHWMMHMFIQTNDAAKLVRMPDHGALDRDDLGHGEGAGGCLRGGRG